MGYYVIMRFNLITTNLMSMYNVKMSKNVVEISRESKVILWISKTHLCSPGLINDDSRGVRIATFPLVLDFSFWCLLLALSTSFSFIPLPYFILFGLLIFFFFYILNLTCWQSVLPYDIQILMNDEG